MGILTTVLVLWVFLPRWGLIATGIGVVCAKTIVAGTLTVIAQRIQPMAWSFRPVIMSIGLTLAIILAGLWVGRVYGLIGFAGVAAGGLVVFFASRRADPVYSCRTRAVASNDQRSRERLAYVWIA